MYHVKENLCITIHNMITAACLRILTLNEFFELKRRDMSRNCTLNILYDSSFS